MKVQDGSGSGHWLKVDSNNRAQVRSQSESVIAVKSLDDGDAYQLFCPGITLLDGSEHNMLFFKNTSTSRSFVISKYLISWSGGNTNYNRPATIRQHLGYGIPTAAATLSGAGNLNTRSGNTASLTVYYGDGGSAGMTQDETSGVQAGEIQVAQGCTVIDLNGSTVIGPGSTVTVTCTATEVGTFSCTVEGYFS